ncbi:MAG: hypothetical protein [Caudoviricetes sp.]|nr:MAG: hypothetical protein [Caudoviricetes sp.]
MQVSLAKRQETLQVSLNKKKINIGNTTFRVACALDISGSMNPLYNNGTMSDFVGKLLPFGMVFDDNQEIDMFAFNHGTQELPAATADVYDDYVGKCMRGVNISGGTAFAPIIEEITAEYFGEYLTTQTKEYTKPGFLNKLFGKKATETVRISVPNTEGVPAIVFFQTDGESSSTSEDMKAMQKASQYPIYWVMVGVGSTRFPQLEYMKNTFDSVSLITVDSLSLSDEDLYDKLLSDGLDSFIKKYEVK